MLGIFAILGFLGLRSITEVRTEFQSELADLRHLRSNIEGNFTLAMFKKLPPYAYKVRACLSNPARMATHSGCTRVAATIWITSDPCWSDARPNHLSVLMPSGEDPFQYDWTFLVTHEPILFERSLQIPGLQ